MNARKVAAFGWLVLLVLFYALFMSRIALTRVSLPFEEALQQTITVPLASLHQDAQTGDLLVFKGSDRDSLIVRGWTGSLETHVALLVRIDSRVYVFNADAASYRINVLVPLIEKTDEKTIEDDDNRFNGGVQMNLLDPYVQGYNGAVYYRRLVQVGQKELGVERLLKFITATNGRPFTRDWAAMLNSIYEKSCQPLAAAAFALSGISRRSARSLAVDKKTGLSESYFCSQLVAQALVEAGVLDGSRPPRCYAPHDFGDEVVRMAGLRATSFAYLPGCLISCENP